MNIILTPDVMMEIIGPIDHFPQSHLQKRNRYLDDEERSGERLIEIGMTLAGLEQDRLPSRNTHMIHNPSNR